MGTRAKRCGSIGRCLQADRGSSWKVCDIAMAHLMRSVETRVCTGSPVFSVDSCVACGASHFGREGIRLPFHTKESTHTFVQWFPRYFSGVMANVQRIRSNRNLTLQCAASESIRWRTGSRSMATATIRVGHKIGTERRQEHFARTNSGSTEHGQRTGKAVFESHGHEEWQRGIEGAWQGHLETLQQCVCELLQKNQQLRMALMVANERGRLHGDARHL